MGSGRAFVTATVACVMAFVFAASVCHATQEIEVTPDHANGLYNVGERIVWRVSVHSKEPTTEARESGAATAPATQPDVPITRATYALKRGGLTVIKQGELDLSAGPVTIETTLDAPGTVLADVKAPGGAEGKEVRGLGGAAVAPERIAVSAPRPEDFDRFWAEKINELQAVPANAQIEPAKCEVPDVRYYKVRMNNIRGSHIYGQLAGPEKEGKFPALLILQWAGVYGLPQWSVWHYAQKGWLCLNIEPHDMPFDQPVPYYKNLQQTALKNYWEIGDTDKDTSYFLRMYLSCYRAAQYLSQRPDWDGKTLVVMGARQGGQQTIITAGLNPKVTAMLALVPSSCDVTGPTIGRAAGFPGWYDNSVWHHDPRILETGRYYDPVNFASRVHCPALVGLGLLDETSPPSGVYAMFNQLATPVKEVIPLVDSDHQATHHNAQAPYEARSNEWMAALAKGERMPPKKQ